MCKPNMKVVSQFRHTPHITKGVLPSNLVRPPSSRPPVPIFSSVNTSSPSRQIPDDYVKPAWELGYVSYEPCKFDQRPFRAWKSEIALRRPFFSHFGTLFEKHQYISFYVSYDDDLTCAGFP